MLTKLEPKQTLAFQTEATELLYGGAAGGMKSFYLRVSAIRWCLEIAGIQVYLFRRTLPDLRDNHLRGPTSLHVMLAEHLASGHVKFRQQENEFEFWNGSILHLCYCDSENDVEKYRGAEIHVLLMDELTHFTEYQYRFLRSRVRRAGLKVQEAYASRLPRIETASNPGSVGHAWVKRTFISPKTPMEVWRAPQTEGGMLRQFIPARLSDNPYLTKDDPTYADRLRGLGSDDLVRAMLEGDWNIIAGQAFEKLNREKHCIDPFTPPSDWICFGSFDWGSSKPFHFGLWCVANGNPLPDGSTYQRGALILYNEYYGWTGKPDDGLRMEVGEVAEGILKKTAGRKLAYIVADPACWKVDGGPSHAETMMRHGVIMRKGDNSRYPGYQEVRGRIAGNADGPMLFATRNCHDGFWRTMPDLVMDKADPEDLDTSQEDHCFVAGTMVLTNRGPFPIEHADGMDVMTTEGFRQCGKIVPRSAFCVRLTFADGSVVKCTPEHKFLTASGEWRRAVDLLDEISYNALCPSASLARLARNIWVSVIGFAANISRERAFACIAPFGIASVALSPRESTCITLMVTAPTTIFQTSRSWIKRNISVIIARKPTIPRGSSPCERGLDDGTEVKRVEHGTQSTGNLPKKNSWSRKLESLANTAANHFWRSRSTRLALSFATLTARQGRCVSVEPLGRHTVYCLHVPSVHNFALSDGTIVHNCYDSIRYGCMSRPWVNVEVKKARQIDRWFPLDDEDEADSWKTA